MRILIAILLAAAAPLAAAIDGKVIELNGQPLPQVMVTASKAVGQSGPAAVTVFTDDNGRFTFPPGTSAATVVAQRLGYRMVDAGVPAASGMQILMRTEANDAGVAPASAWLAHANAADKEQVVMTCVACHQFPAPEVRAYAKLIHDVPAPDRQVARQQSWHAMVKYMNYLSAWEFGRGVTDALPDAERVYSGGEAEPTAALLARTLIGPLQQLEGYQYGAPLIATARTVIREYEVPAPNAIREAVMLDDSRHLWAADVSANRIVRIDMATGALRDFEIPAKRPMGPHTLLRSSAGELWVAPFFNGIVARLNPRDERWQVWQLAAEGDRPPGVHDLTFGSDHELLTDRRGRIWYSDIVNNAVGWFDPGSGKSGIHRVPPIPGRTGREALYGMVMASDRTRVWYSQLGTGSFGSFNVETLEFETVVQLPGKSSGPRRITMSDKDVLYVPLYGAGQLVEYDARARKIIGTYDLPDRASAPYAVTWDPKRKVVWIPTSNANVIYRFDPRDKSFGVLPLPREGGFLRMLQVDKKSGALITSYANIVENVHGPRMAVMIDPGDQSAGASR